MKRILIGTAVVVLAAVPAAIGLWGNASFSQQVPVRVPASGQIATLAPTSPTVAPRPSPSTDDNGGATPRDQRIEPGDDRDVQGGSVGSPGASPSPSVADDQGGDVPRDQRTEPGDDHGSGSGSGDSGSDDSGSGSGDSGSGSGDSGSGGSGSGGSGSGDSGSGGDDDGGHGGGHGSDD